MSNKSISNAKEEGSKDNKEFIFSKEMIIYLSSYSAILLCMFGIWVDSIVLLSLTIDQRMDGWNCT
jgi:hypothetical protein